jgi:hypothetical protein
MSGAPPHGWPVHQEDDAIASTRLARLAAGGTVILCAGVVVAGALLVAVTGRIRPAGGSQQGPAQIAGIEQTPVREMRSGLDLQEAQRRELDRWGWADRQAGIATIPIDRAIDRVVEEAAR